MGWTIQPKRRHSGALVACGSCACANEAGAFCPQTLFNQIMVFRFAGCIFGRRMGDWTLCLFKRMVDTYCNKLAVSILIYAPLLPHDLDWYIMFCAHSM